LIFLLKQNRNYLHKNQKEFTYLFEFEQRQNHLKAFYENLNDMLKLEALKYCLSYVEWLLNGSID
jgi:hypothetical protein